MAAKRSAQAIWENDLLKGSGRFKVQSGALPESPISWAARTEQSGGKTSPEELLAAAHGGCLTMSVASELTQAGAPPTRLDTTCLIVMDEVEGEGHQIVASHITIAVDADAGDDAVGAAIERADAGCPFSTLLRKAGVDVTIARA